ncbi:MAG TPA: hypothetical protein VF427_03430 [Noviherbaspirillum sp.]
MLEPQHVVIQTEPDIESPQENALPHPNQALQSQQRPASARQLAEQLKNGTAQLTNGVTRAVNTMKNNPKLVAGLVATGTLATTALLAENLMHSVGSPAYPHHVMRDSGASGAYGGGAYASPDSDSSSPSYTKIVAFFGGIGALGGLAAAYFMCRNKAE